LLRFHSSWLCAQHVSITILCIIICSSDRSCNIGCANTRCLLVLTLDSYTKLMDSSTGKMLNDFTGHVNEAYRCCACFSHAEASVVCSDENGQESAWDLLGVCPLRSFYNFTVSQNPQRRKSYSQIRLLRLMKKLIM